MCGEHIQELYTVIDQIPILKYCFTTPNKNLGGEGASGRLTPAAKSLYWSILKKSRHLGLECTSYLVHGRDRGGGESEVGGGRGVRGRNQQGSN